MYLLYLLLLSGYIFSHGFFSFPSIGILLSTYIVSIIFFLKPKVIKNITDLRPGHILILSTILSLVLYGGLYQNTNTYFIGWSYIMLCFALFFSILFTIPNRFVSRQFIFASLIFIAVMIRLFMVWSSPDPVIDVFAFQKYGALNLLSGNNPYASTYQPVYSGQKLDYYAYPPGNLLITTIFVWIFGDPRFTFIIAELLLAMLIWQLLKGKKYQAVFTAIILYNPISPFIIEQSYMEPLAVLLLAGCIWSFIHKRILLSAVIFGICLSTKQYLALLIPIYYGLCQKISRNLRVRMFILTVITMFVLCAPFIAWDKNAFMKNIIYLQYQYPPRYEGLTVFSLLHKIHIDYNPLLSGFIILPIMFLIFIRGRITTAKFFFSAMLSLFTFFLFNKWAFINYYYFISQILLVSIAFDQHKNLTS